MPILPSASIVVCGSEQSEGMIQKTAHQLSHERADLLYQSRLPAWRRQQQQPMTSSEDAETALLSLIDGSNGQRCGTVRRCRCILSTVPIAYRPSIIHRNIVTSVSEMLLCSGTPLFPTPPLVSPKFPHVPLRVGKCPLGYEKRRCWANCPCN